jgi:drug/metabolite transporter (DMT)-like permease
MTKTKHGISSVDIAILGAAFVWGSSYLASRELTHFASLWGMMALRFILAGILLYMIRFIRPAKFTKAEVLASLGIAATLALVMTVETTGIYLTSATNSGLIISLSILFTPIIEGLVSKFWMPRMFYISALGAIFGVGILISGNGFTPFLKGSSPRARKLTPPTSRFCSLFLQAPSSYLLTLWVP